MLKRYGDLTFVASGRAVVVSGRAAISLATKFGYHERDVWARVRARRLAARCKICRRRDRREPVRCLGCEKELFYWTCLPGYCPACCHMVLLPHG